MDEELQDVNALGEPVSTSNKNGGSFFKRVTVASKFFTAFLLMGLPVLGFILGMTFQLHRSAYVHSCEAIETQLIGCNLQNQREKMKAQEAGVHPLSIVGVTEDVRMWVPVTPDGVEPSMSVVDGGTVRPVALDGSVWRSTSYYECGDELPSDPFAKFQTNFIEKGWDTNIVTGSNLSVQSVAADGPFESAEGYVKVSGGTVRAITLRSKKEYFGSCTYEPDNSKSTCPLYEKTCPLNLELEIFVSDEYLLEKVYDQVGVIEGGQY